MGQSTERSEAMNAKKAIEQKARAALEWWLNGMMQGGHDATPADIAAVWNAALSHYEKEAQEAQQPRQSNARRFEHGQ